MTDKIYLIGLGHRAQNGKDSVANFIKQQVKNCEIFHFADPLKKEVMNTERKIPLIYRHKSKYANHYWYNVWSHDGEYRSIAEESLPFLHKIFEGRKIDEYWGMDGNGNDEKKDAPMLQFWGTEWRRRRFADNYWIQKVEDYFFNNFYNKQFVGDAYFLLPDTRFKNEVKWIRDMDNSNDREEVSSHYVKVVRYNDDNTPYYDPSRDPNHQSEVDLEGVKSDYLIEAKSGEMEVLEKKSKEFLEYIKVNLSYVII